MLRIALIAGGVAALGVLAWAGTRTSTPPHPTLRTAQSPPEAADDSAAFPPLPPPGPNDWLANHDEPGQTFWQFQEGRRVPVRPDRRSLGVLPLDDLARIGVSTDVLVEHLSAYYGLPARRIEVADLPQFTTRDNPRTGTRQTLTTDVLKWLERQVPEGTYGVIALTTEDLYPDPEWNFVFGQASLEQRVGVFSFARMKADRVLFLRRCLKVVAHEVGHMFGIEHCTRSLCLMNGCNHVAEMDRTPLHLCPVCLRKIVLATGVDVAERYRSLGAIYRREGLDAEADWVAARLRDLGSAEGGRR